MAITDVMVDLHSIEGNMGRPAFFSLGKAIVFQPWQGKEVVTKATKVGGQPEANRHWSIAMETGKETDPIACFLCGGPHMLWDCRRHECLLAMVAIDNHLDGRHYGNGWADMALLVLLHLSGEPSDRTNGCGRLPQPTVGFGIGRYWHGTPLHIREDDGSVRPSQDD